MKKQISILVLVLLVSGAMSAVALALTKTDKNFLDSAALSGTKEVKLGEVAQQKADSPDVKAFAARMIQDHSKANEELKALAQSKKAKMPPRLESKIKSGMTELTKLSGGEFDKKYMTDMVKDHAADVAEFEHAGSIVKDADLKAWAEKTLPVLQDHLNQAKDIAQKLGVDVNAAEQQGQKEAAKKMKSM